MLPVGYLSACTNYPLKQLIILKSVSFAPPPYADSRAYMQTIAERERMEEERLAEQAREQERLKSRKVWTVH